MSSSVVLIPGIPLLNNNFLAFVYLVILVYLFIGIIILAEVFME